MKISRDVLIYKIWLTQLKKLSSVVLTRFIGGGIGVCREECDIQNLKHMLGATEPPSKWGYRNYFAAGSADLISMRRLEKAGFVVERNSSLTDSLFTATVEGCKLLKFTQPMIDYAFEK